MYRIIPNANVHRTHAQRKRNNSILKQIKIKSLTTLKTSYNHEFFYVRLFLTKIMNDFHLRYIVWPRNLCLHYFLSILSYFCFACIAYINPLETTGLQLITLMLMVFFIYITSLVRKMMIKMINIYPILYHNILSCTKESTEKKKHVLFN